MVLLLIYIPLLFGFLILSGLIARHVFHHGYLSPRFRIIALAFGIIALMVILFSFYLLFLFLDGATLFQSGAGGGGF